MVGDRLLSMVDKGWKLGALDYLIKAETTPGEPFRRRAGLGKGVDEIDAKSHLSGGFDLDKPLYTISVASEILETHPRTLMMYEDLGLIEPYRTATNRRRYSQRNIRKLQVIQQLTRERGVNLAGVKYILMLLVTLKEGKVPPPDDLRPIYELYREII